MDRCLRAIINPTMQTQVNSDIPVRLSLPSEMSVMKMSRPLPPLDGLIPEEDRVNILANTLIPQETRFHPLSGRIHNESLPCVHLLERSDIRYENGAYDRYDEYGRRESNWLRFVTLAKFPNYEVNMIAKRIYPPNQVVYETIRDIEPGCKIVAYIPNMNFMADLYSSLSHFPLVRPRYIEAPLDLSRDTTSPRQRNGSVSPDSPHQYSSEEEEGLNSNNAPIAFQAPPSLLRLRLPQPFPYMPPRLAYMRSPIARTDSPPSEVPDHLRKVRSPKPKSLLKRKKEKTLLSCSNCPKRFDRPSLLVRHQRTHTGEKPHTCDCCQKSFSTSSSLNTHKRIHSGEKPHQCPTCGKCFTASSNLYYHKMTHIKEKPHKCTMCTRSFPTPGDLRTHMYTHTKKFPFVCEVCNKGFGKRTNLKSHEKSHKKHDDALLQSQKVSA